MNSLEREMVNILAAVRSDYGATAVKASMEAEGISLSEMLRTKEIVTAAGVGLTVKIGGCEALTDARLAKAYGASALMSPMIESRFALEKYLDMVASVFSAEEREGIKILINIETFAGYENIDDILKAKNIQFLDGIVLGRTDLSCALRIADVDNPQLAAIAKELFRKAKGKGLRCVVGGGITEKTIPFLEELDGLIDGFETRKVVFTGYEKARRDLHVAIRQALHFEYLWYKLRQQMYLELAEEDAGRIKKLASVLTL